MRTPNNRLARAGTVAGDADVQWRIQNALQFEISIATLFVGIEHRYRFGIGLLETIQYALALGQRFDQYEIPWLHKADGRCLVGGLQNAGEFVISDGIGQKFPSYIAPLGDYVIKRIALGSCYVSGSPRIFHILLLMANRSLPEKHRLAWKTRAATLA
jgi:hypothetical protein